MNYNVHNYIDIEHFNLLQFKTFKNKEGVFIDCSMAFDIETSSFFVEKKTNKIVSLAEYDKQIKLDTKYDDKVNKSSLCYIWQFAIGDSIFIGRKLEDFVKFIDLIKVKINNRKIIVYVHNLSYEFQFIRNYFDWIEVFALDNRKVLTAKTDFIVFKCSYLLSGKSLSKLTDDIHDTKIEKLTGDLDYKLLRNEKTVLSETELKYCYNDVLIVTAYIKEQAELYGRLDKIPLTNTGRVRRYVRKECFKNKVYPTMIHKSLTFSPLEYKLARLSFQGGFTHCSRYYSNLVCKNVSSYDFTSSYPTVMLTEKYPMTKGINYKITDYKKIIELSDKYCLMFSIEIYNLSVKKELQPIISLSKCLSYKDIEVDNGRLTTAKYIKTVMNEIDLLDFIDMYKFEDIKIGICFIYKKSYLPIEIINSILKFYSDKTTLKDVKGKEVEYMLSKNMLNSIYGMSVYNPIKTQYDYNSNSKQWTSTDKIIDDTTVTEYNEDKNRFTSYLWGVYVTSYARHNLYSGIKEFNYDFIYCDTDSIKVLHNERHLKYIENYNHQVIEKLYKMCDFFKIDRDKIQPQNIKGDKKIIGIWDYEGTYKLFKSLGAKRYLLLDSDNKIGLTVSGINKKLVVPYLWHKYKTIKNIFDNFTNNLYIPKEYSGKKTHTYIDVPQGGMITDYQGNICKYSTPSGVHLIECDFKLNMLVQYLDFITTMQKTII